MSRIIFGGNLLTWCKKVLNNNLLLVKGPASKLSIWVCSCQKIICFIVTKCFKDESLLYSLSTQLANLASFKSAHSVYELFTAPVLGSAVPLTK